MDRRFRLAEELDLPELNLEQVHSMPTLESLDIVHAPNKLSHDWLKAVHVLKRSAHNLWVVLPTGLPAIIKAWEKYKVAGYPAFTLKFLFPQGAKILASDKYTSHYTPADRRSGGENLILGYHSPRKMQTLWGKLKKEFPEFYNLLIPPPPEPDPQEDTPPLPPPR